jgi:hypothetical protein
MKSILLALSLALASLAGAVAAPLTSTTTPETIFLFVAVLPAVKEDAPYRELYRTADQAACDKQAAEWSAKLAPAKFVCLPHAQKKLKASGESADE